MYNQIANIIFSKEQIAQAVLNLGEQINKDFQGQEIVLVGLLKSSIFFLSDLIRCINSDKVIVDFLGVSDYGSPDHDGGPIRITKEIEENIEDKTVILVDLFLDSGLTLKFALDHLKNKKVRELKTCVLMSRQDCLVTGISLDYTCFVSNERAFVGYGADWHGKFRHLPFIGILKELK